MWEPSKTNKALKFFGYLTMIFTIITTLLILFIEDLEMKFIYSIGVFIGGTIYALILFAASEILTRLLNIEYNTSKAKDHIEQIKNRAS